MAFSIDPETGLPVDDAGALVDPEVSGSAFVTEQVEPPHIDFSEPEHIEFTEPDFVGNDEGGALLEAVAEVAADEEFGLANPEDIEILPHEGPAEAPLVGAKTGDRVSIATRGITEGGTRKAKGFFGKAQAQADTRNLFEERRYAENQRRMERVFQLQKEALDERTTAEKDYLTNISDIRRQELEFKDAELKLEQMAYEQAKQEGAAYIAQYKQDMAGVRQLMLQTGNPLGGLDTSGKMALAGAMFVQGFLGTRGIQVDVAGQVERWVEREMAAHQQMISNQMGAAKTNLTLYNLAKQGAQDDVEARSRLRGFVIDGIKTKLQMEADRYGAQSAMADAKHKAAELDALLLKNDLALQEKVSDRVFRNNQLAVQQAAAQAKASVEYAEVEVARQREARMAEKERKEAEAAALKETWDGRIVDVGSNEYVAAFDTAAPAPVLNKAVEGVQKAEESFRQINRQVDKLREMYGQAKKEGIVGVRWMDSAKEAKYRLYQAQAIEIIAGIVKADSGLAATDKEYERRAKALEPDKLFQSGDNAKLIELFQDSLRNRYRASINSYVGKGVRRLKPNETGQAPGEIMLDVAGQAQNDIALTDVASFHSPMVDATRLAQSGEGEFSDDTQKQEGFFDLPILNQRTRAWSSLIGDEPQLEASRRVEEMARGILDPASYRELHKGASWVPKDDRLLRAQLAESIETIAKHRHGKDQQSSTALFADHLMDLLAADPRGAAELLFDIPEEPGE